MRAHGASEEEDSGDADEEEADAAAEALEGREQALIEFFSECVRTSTSCEWREELLIQTGLSGWSSGTLKLLSRAAQAVDLFGVCWTSCITLLMALVVRGADSGRRCEPGKSAAERALYARRGHRCARRARWQQQVQRPSDPAVLGFPRSGERDVQYSAPRRSDKHGACNTAHAAGGTSRGARFRDSAAGRG